MRTLTIEEVRWVAGGDGESEACEDVGAAVATLTSVTVSALSSPLTASEAALIALSAPIISSAATNICESATTPSEPKVYEGGLTPLPTILMQEEMWFGGEGY